MDNDEFRYLKWNDDVVGIVHRDLSVSFAKPALNPTVSLYTRAHRHGAPPNF